MKGIQQEETERTEKIDLKAPFFPGEHRVHPLFEKASALTETIIAAERTNERPDSKRGNGDRRELLLCFLSYLLFTFKNGWTVISMKNDWKVIFPFESKSEHPFRERFYHNGVAQFAGFMPRLRFGVRALVRRFGLRRLNPRLAQNHP